MKITTFLSLFSILILIISIRTENLLSDPCDCPEHLIGADDPFDCGCFGTVKSKKEEEEKLANGTDTSTTLVDNDNGEPINETGIGISPYYEDDKQMNNYIEKEGLWPLTRREFFATLIIAVGSAFISYGGIGGGIYIPTLMIVADYSIEVSLPISATIVFGSFLSNLIFILFQRHPNYPKVKRPRIDYDLAAIASPILSAGSIFGVIFNLIFPRWLTLIVMIIVLLFSSATVFKWGIQELKQYIRHGKVQSCGCGGGNNNQKNEEETEETEETEEEEGGEEESITSEITETSSSDISSTDSNSSGSEYNYDGDDDIENNQSIKKTVTFLQKYESLQIQPFQLALFFFVQIFITLIAYLRGSKHGGSIIGVEVCGDTWYWYWILTFFNIIFLIFVTYGVSTILYFIHSYKSRSDVKHLFNTEKELGVISWNARNSFLFPLLFFLVGIIVGFLGICGCMVYSPIFLQLGVLSEVSCATSTVLTIFTNGSTMIQYFFMGRLDWQFTLFYGGTAFFSALVGRFALSYPIEKLKMRFVLTFIIGVVILGGTIAIATLQISVLWNDWKEGNYDRFKFHWICD